MFDLFPQQNFTDWLKWDALRQPTPALRDQALTAIRRLEKARVWQPVAFAQAIDQVQPGAIWSDAQFVMHIEGGAPTLAAIVDAYLALTGQPVQEHV